VKPLAAAKRSPRCFGLSANRLSISLRLNGKACPTRSGSSSDAKVVPPLARESPSLLIANFFTMHPDVAATIVSSNSQRAALNFRDMVRIRGRILYPYLPPKRKKMPTEAGSALTSVRRNAWQCTPLVAAKRCAAKAVHPPHYLLEAYFARRLHDRVECWRRAASAARTREFSASPREAYGPPRSCISVTGSPHPDHRARFLPPEQKAYSEER